MPNLSKCSHSHSPMTTATMSPLHLPQELVDSIIDCLCGDIQALTTCALVSTAWKERSRFHIFSSVVIQIPSRRPNSTWPVSPQHSSSTTSIAITTSNTRWEGLLGLIACNPSLVQNIRSIKFAGKPYDGMPHPWLPVDARAFETFVNLDTLTFAHLEFDHLTPHVIPIICAIPRLRQLTFFHVESMPLLVFSRSSPSVMDDHVPKPLHAATPLRAISFRHGRVIHPMTIGDLAVFVNALFNTGAVTQTSLTSLEMCAGDNSEPDTWWPTILSGIGANLRHVAIHIRLGRKENELWNTVPDDGTCFNAPIRLM